MLRKSLMAFTAATVVGAGSQAVGLRDLGTLRARREFPPHDQKRRSRQHRHMPKFRSPKLDRKDLIGKKMYDHQGNFLGKVVSVTKDDAGEIVSVQLRATVIREARVLANQVNIKPDGGTRVQQGAAMEPTLPHKAGTPSGLPPGPGDCEIAEAQKLAHE
jgi:hypothetical protein